jgi:hypothetical protein
VALTRATVARYRVSGKRIRLSHRPADRAAQNPNAARREEDRTAFDKTARELRWRSAR